MTPEQAMRWAQVEAEGKPMNEQMRVANRIFVANSTDWRKPFASVDIVFATFVDYLKDSCTQRERDLVLVSDQLCPVWKTLHLTMQTMGEQPSPADERAVANVVNALHRLGLRHLLTEGLRSDLCEWLDVLVAA